MSGYFRGIILGGGGGLKFRYCKILEGRGLGKSGLKFRHGGEGYQKWPKKFRRLLWTAPDQIIDSMTKLIKK